MKPATVSALPARRSLVGTTGFLHVRLLALGAALACAVSGAPSAKAQPAGGAPSLPERSARRVSPEVRDDGSVIFRLAAPEAGSVLIEGDFWHERGRREPMVRDGAGGWTFTLGPLPGDYYSYDFVMDGVPIADPQNPRTKPGRPFSQSAFMVPGKDADFLQLRDVPHGEVRQIRYTSSQTGRQRRYHLYLPPGYGEDGRSYPVIYLFHGGGDDDRAWTTIGRADLIMDNLIADGRISPAILVMPDMWATDPAVMGDRQNEAVFRSELLEDISPQVEAMLNVAPGPANRSLGGLGMGRAWLPRFIWPVLPKFGRIFFVSGGVSESLFSELEAEHPGALDAQGAKTSFFLGVGEHDAAAADSANLARLLERRDYPVARWQGQGAHGWPAFRRAFAAFLETAFPARTPEP